MGVPDFVLGLTAREQPPRPRWPAWPPHIWVGTLWPLLLALLTVKETERLPWGQSTMITLVAAGANASIEFVFIR